MTQSSTIRLIDLRTGSVQEIPASGGEVTAIDASDLNLDGLPSSAILGTMRVGDDLIVNLANGGQIIVRDFFAFSRTGEVLDDAGVPMVVGTDSGSSSSGGVMSATTGGGLFAGLTVAALLLADAYEDDQTKTNPATPPDEPGGGGPTDAEQALATINAYDGTGTAPTAANYTTAGVTGVNEANLAGVNAQVAASTNNMLAATDIDAFVTTTGTALTTINAYAGTGTAPTADDYGNIGAEGVTAANLAGVNAQVAASADDSLTAADIAGFITAAAASLTTINAYDAENTAPTADDYRNAGVTGVTAANLAALNAAVARVDEDTTLDIMAIEMLLPRANVVAKINAYDGSEDTEAPTPEDYAAVGVTGLTADRIGVANALLAAANEDKEAGEILDTAQLQPLLDIAQDMEDALGVLPPPATMTVTTGSFNIRIDINDDGTADMLVEVETNEAGIPTSITYDFDNDGSTDRSERYTVNTDGRRTAAAIDLDVHGTAERTETYNLNAAGRRTQARIDTDGNGTVDRIETYTLNEAGQRTQTAIDTDADGTADRVETYTLNAAGIRTGVTIDTADNGTPNGTVDGTVDRRETYTLNAAGQRTQTDFDDNADGTVDRRETYTLNAEGQRTATAFDGDADADGTADGTVDGTVDRRETYTLNEAGQRRATSFDGDASGTADGTADRSESYTLNAVGQITETEFDDNADGNPDRTVTNDNLPPVTAAERAVAALLTINAYRTGGSTEPSIADYNAAGVTGVTTTAIRDQLNMSVRGQQSSNDDLTTATLQPLATQAIAVVALATLNAWDGDPDDNGNPSAPTLADYTAAGADDVTAANLAGVNARLAGITQAQTADQIDTLAGAVTTALNTLNAWDGDPDDNNMPPAPVLTDYQNAGADDVTAANLAGVNHRLGGISQTQSVTQINTLAEAVTAALATLNAWDGDPDSNGNPSAPTLPVYQNAGIDGVTAANLDEVNMRLGPVTDTLSAADITALANAGAIELALGRINDYRTGASTTAPSSGDYIAVGLTGVTAAVRTELNSLVRGQQSGNDLTATTIMPLFDMAVTTVALATINAYRTGDSATAPSEADYMAAGVNGVTSTNLAALNMLVRGEESRSDDLDATTIQPLVATANTNVALATINAYRTDPDNVTPPTEADYTAAGATGANAVTADNIAAVHLQVVAASSTPVTASTLGGLVTAANTAITMALATINAYDGDNTEPTDTNYQTLGVTGITATNLPGVNAQVAASSDDSLERADIQTFVTNANDSLARIRAYTGSNTEPTLTDYLNVGVEDVTAAFGNLARVNEQVEDTAANARSSLTPTQIQALVTAAALDKINDYRVDQNDNDNTLSVDDYRIAGVNDVSDETLTDLNAWVAMQNSALAANDIQAQATMLDNESGAGAARAIINAWDGDPDGNSMPPAPTITDYMTARVTGLVEDNLEFYNNRVAGLSTQTLDELNTLVSQANAALVIINAYDGDNTAPTVDHYTNIGLGDTNEVTAANLLGVNAQLATAAANMRELSHLEGFISTTNMALQTIRDYTGSNTVPNADHYINAGVTGVTMDNLDAVNDLVEIPANPDGTVDAIQTLANKIIALAKINAYRMNQSNDEPTLPDYMAAGATDVTATNLDAVNDRLTALTTEQDETDINTIAQAFTTINAYNRNNTAPTQANYDAIGADAVTAANIAGVNYRLGGITQFHNTSQINTLAGEVTTALNTLNAWDGSGTAPTLTDYTNAGISGVTDSGQDNLPGVNARVAGASGNQTAADIQAIVAAVRMALGRIRDEFSLNGPSAPMIEDYANAGLKGIDDAITLRVINSIVLSDNEGDAFFDFEWTQNLATVVADVANAPDVLRSGSLATNQSITSATNFRFGINNDGNTGAEWFIFATITDTQRVITYRATSNTSDPILRQETHTLNSNGVSTRIEIDGVDSDANGTLDTAELYDGTPDIIQHDDGMNGGVAADGTIDRTEVRQITSSDGLVLTDATNDGTIELVQVTADASAELLSDDYTAHGVTKSLLGLEEIRMHPMEASTLTLSSLVFIDTLSRDGANAPENDSYQLLIQGGADDTVSLTDASFTSAYFSWSIEDENTDGTADIEDVGGTNYAVYRAVREGNNMFGRALVQQGVAVQLQAALNTINAYAGSGTAPTLATYAQAGATDVDAGNLAGVNNQVAASTDRPTLTLMQLNAFAGIADMALQTLNDWAGSGTPPDEDDYSNVGINGVTAGNLAAVNMAVRDAPDNQTAQEFTALVTMVIRGAAETVIRGYDGMDGTTVPNLGDYTAFGADDVTAGNLRGVNAQVAASNDRASLTATELNAFASTTNDAIDDLQNPGAVAPTDTIYRNAGVAGVHSGNVDAVTTRLLNNQPSPPTNQEYVTAVSMLVTMVVEDALTAIREYAGSGTAPTVPQYSTINVRDDMDNLAVNEDNLPGVNAQVAASNDRANLVASDIATFAATTNTARGIINDYNAMTDTSPSVQNYRDVGVTGVTEDPNGNLDDVNTRVRMSGETDLSTMEIQEFVTLVNAQQASARALAKIRRYAQNQSDPNDEPNSNDYTALRNPDDSVALTGVTSGNISQVNMAVASLDNTATIAQIVMALAPITALATIRQYDGDGTPPTVALYMAANANDVDEGNLRGVNAQVAASASRASLGSSQLNTFAANADSSLTLIDDYRKDTSISMTAPGVDNYLQIGVTTVTADPADPASPDTISGLTAINSAVTDFTLPEGQTSLTAADVAAIVALHRINSSFGDFGSELHPTPADYADAGVTGVTAANIMAINDLVRADSTELDADDLQVLVSLRRINAYATNNAPNADDIPTVEDYQSAGVNYVTADNLDAINSRIDMANNANQTAATIQTTLQQIAETKITTYNGTGNAPLAIDYLAAGLTGFEPSLLDFANYWVGQNNSNGVGSFANHYRSLFSALAIVEDELGALPATTALVNPGITSVLLEFGIDTDGMTDVDGNPTANQMVRIGLMSNQGGRNVSSISIDLENDGSPDRHYEFAINFRGSGSAASHVQTSVTIHEDDTNVQNASPGVTAADAAARAQTYSYNNDSHIIETSFFDAGGTDSTISRIEKYQVNDDGHRTMTTFFDDGRDTNDGGAADRIEHYTLNNLSQVTRIDYDGGDTDEDGTTNGTADNTIDASWNITLNNLGQRIRIEKDYDNDGTANRIELDDNGDGNIDRILVNTDDSGDTDRIDFPIYNSDGELEATFEETDSDDNFNALVLENGADFELMTSYPNNKGIVGLGNIILSGDGPSEVTLSWDTLVTISNRDATDQLFIRGDSDDTVVLTRETGDGTIRNANRTQGAESSTGAQLTYNVYEVVDTGASPDILGLVLIENTITMVTIPS